jgi:tRNA(Met) C34 N-acetyltransferase TmcA
MIELHPTTIDAYEGGGRCFTVQAFDEVCAEIKISALQTAASWPATAAAIQKALEMMRLEEK